jgi:hypothetical protein
MQSGVFEEISLDYYYAPSIWSVQRWKNPFFSKTLIDLKSVLTNTGAIYLPFMPICFEQITRNLSLIERHYIISYVRKGCLDEVMLWTGTQQIAQDTMLRVFGKNRNEEESRCNVSLSLLRASCDETVSSFLLNRFVELDKSEDIRFIRLTKR